MWGKILTSLWGGTKAIAAGKTQANLGLQSPHLPAAMVRVGRFIFTTSGIWIAGTWYSGYANMRTQPGSGPKLVLPGAKVIGTPSRPDKAPKFAGNLNPVAVPGGSLGSAKTLPGGSKAGGFLPRNATYKPGRADQGRDGSTDPGGPMVANGNGIVVAVKSDTGGFGPDYPLVKFTSGPDAGHVLYFGHTHAAQRVGAKLVPGSVISYTGKTPVGNATVPGWFEVGYADSGTPGRFGQPTPF